MLSDLARQYGTDKLGNYSRFYEWLLSPKRAIYTVVLELGIGTPEAMSHMRGYEAGASLRMWRDYFPQARVYGFDNDTEAIFNFGDRIQARCFDAGSKNSLMLGAQWVGSKIDFIVDDADHDPYHQALACHTLWPYLSDGGTYIIEDVNNAPSVLDSVAPFNPALVTFAAEAGRQDRCIVMRKEERG